MQFDCRYEDPLLICSLPKEIQIELKKWVKICRKIKNHPLSELKAHENIGYLSFDGKKHNSYQCSVPTFLVENSFWLSYVLRVCSNYCGGDHRDYKIRKWDGHFDGYDVWVNFSYEGDDNPAHSHAGTISGVIYVQNDEHPTVFPDYNIEYNGENGTMVLFPSETVHYVNKKTTNSERITIAFNIVKIL